MRQFYLKTRYEVFGDTVMGMNADTDALDDILQTNLNGYCLSDVKTPKCVKSKTILLGVVCQITQFMSVYMLPTSIPEQPNMLSSFVFLTLCLSCN